MSICHCELTRQARPAFALGAADGGRTRLPLRGKSGQARRGDWGTSGHGVGEKGRFSDEKSESKENIVGG